MKYEKLEDRNAPHLEVGHYDYDGLAHWFFYNSGYETTAEGRMSCRENKIKSYSTCIGELFQNKKGDVIFLYSGFNYTPTTTKQMGIILQALPYNIKSVEVDNIDEHTPKEHIKGLLDSSLVLFGRSKRARLNKEMYLNDAKRALKDICTIASFFNLKRSSEYKQAIKLLNDTSLYVLVENKVNKAKKAKIAKKKRAIEVRQKELKELNILKSKVFKNAFLGGDEWTTNYKIGLYNTGLRGLSYAYRDVNNHDLIRIENDKIVSSQNIQLPLKLARKMFNKWTDGKLKQGDKILSFRVLEVEKDFIIVGCHKIMYEQVRKVFNDNTMQELMNDFKEIKNS
jgi:hypothetical protein